MTAAPATTETRIEPQAGPQADFLSSSADIVIYGGAAGGGKTWSQLIEPLRHIRRPGFSAVIFRRTFPQIHNEGGLWDSSMQIYPHIGGIPRESDSEWVFPPHRTTISFRHLQYDKTVEDWQSAQIPLIEWDELTQFSGHQFWYMLSRNRSMCGVRPYMRGTCNPDPDSFVRELIDWWIDKDGWAIPERCGRIRYFRRASGQLIWGNTPQQVIEQMPLGMLQDEVASGVVPIEQVKSLTFIRSRLKDNQALLRTNPEYLGNLLALLPVEREQLYGDGERGGNWNVRASAGKIFNRGWFRLVPVSPMGGRVCSFWDLAATEKKLVKGNKANDPDYTVRWRMRQGLDKRFYVEDVQWWRLGPADIDRIILNLSWQDHKLARATGASFMMRFEMEGGAAGPRDAYRIVTMLAGLDCAWIKPEGDPITRSKGLASQAQAGNVDMVEGDWNEYVLNHLHNQPSSHDDIMVAGAGSLNVLTSAVEFDPAAAGGAEMLERYALELRRQSRHG